ncbi:MAG TPA: dienelactone hydrolase family protein [Acetobacteraceae bacterium]|jgi:carboxymethylenebutenolidase|nr:dienelactone hydrolase family protein [Acetobacteraceae bacterium]
MDEHRIGRRGALASGLIAGLTLATARVEAQVINTDTVGLDAGEVRVAVGADQVPAYYAKPDRAGTFPIVLVVEEIFGVHHYIQDICRRLAKLGYLAIAPELFWRFPDLAQLTSSAEIMSQVVSKTPDADVTRDLDGASAWAAAHGGDARRLAVIGFCRGGRDVWLFAAHNARLRAAVAWYGPLGGKTSPIQPETALDVAGAIHCPLLGLYGGQDPSSTPAQIAEAQAKAKASGRTVEIIVYPDAPHGFHADYRPSYRKADAEDGWRRMLAWLHRYDA